MQWKWDRGRWGDGGKVGEVVEALTKVRHLIILAQEETDEA